MSGKVPDLGTGLGGEATGSPRWPSWLPTLRDVGDALLQLVTTTLGLGVAVLALDGVTAARIDSVLVAAAVVGVGDLLLRPALRVMALVSGAMGALVAGLAAQVVIVWFALWAVPGLHVSGAGDVIGVLVITAVVMAVGRWLIGANDSAYVVGDVLRRARRKARRHGTAPTVAGPGMLVVQLDGVSTPVLRQAAEAGLTPTMDRWIRSGSHNLTSWWAQVPATTPASQAGLLHGDSSGVPSFRWWDKQLGRLVVTNHPADAALVESRMTTGGGLLAPDGAAISTMFSGDAATCLLVMSRALGHGGFGPGPAYVRFFSSPFVLARALVMTVGEMVKELYQGRRQRVRRVRPRVRRLGAYVLARGVSNVLLRDLNVSLVAEQLLRGTPIVFVDLVDYDEIAHHAGPTRPESLRALEGLDRELWLLEAVLSVAPRPYDVVVLSDHGQSLGDTFEQVEGRSLLDVVRSLMDVADDAGLRAGEGEDWGPLNALLTSAFGRAARAGGTTVGAGDDRAGRSAATGAGDLPEVAVIASGNLGMIWFPRLPGRVPLEEIRSRWPGLVPGLASLASVAVVVAQTRSRGPVAVGADGLCVLSDGTVEGSDPLTGLGSRARPDLARVAGMVDAGDLVLVSTVDAGGRVHAFEGLVGSHGGLGGAQNDAFLLHPAGWVVGEDLLEDVDGRRMPVGAEQVHLQLVRWAREQGLRA
ncbi:type I phosphodiesterase / nucleotide pyrophosphatase [mine drainage metagenome]|uniref:Type I phosphodiesterase / nucleotide pyrophosphatase n=1 Tax=mine drainage metagenome TaxID=410659 RepID=A0A1J5QH88_9ZZZZ